MARYGNFLVLLMLALVSGIFALSINRNLDDTTLVTRDVPAVPGTVIPDWSRPPGSPPDTTGHGLQYFGARCWGPDHHWFDTANDEFCKRVDRMVFFSEQREYQRVYALEILAGVLEEGTRPGSIFMQTDFGLGASPDVAYTMTYAHCCRAMQRVIDSCDTSNMDHKHGGRLDHGSNPLGNDVLFYVNDPSSRAGLEQPDTQGNFCMTDYWSPWSRNVIVLPTMEDVCFSKWCGHNPDGFTHGARPWSKDNPRRLPNFDPCRLATIALPPPERK